MSEADRMFESLGYKKENLKDKFDRIWGINYQNEKEWIDITIDHIDKEVCISTIGDVWSCGEPVYIGMQELQAINEKVKELGWLDE